MTKALNLSVELISDICLKIDRDTEWFLQNFELSLVQFLIWTNFAKWPIHWNSKLCFSRMYEYDDWSYRQV